MPKTFGNHWMIREQIDPGALYAIPSKNHLTFRLCGSRLEDCIHQMNAKLWMAQLPKAIGLLTETVHEIGMIRHDDLRPNLEIPIPNNM